ncbi:MAG: Ig-like domain-containing protein [Candidatus Puniceispirillaceae bacterium]
MRFILYMLFGVGGVLVALALGVVFLGDDETAEVAPQTQSIDLSSKPVDEPANTAGDNAPAPQVDGATPESPALDTQPSVGPALSIEIARVKPDGAAVVAGSAPPGATVSVFEDKILLGKTTADANGEWVVVLEKRLGPGQHLISVAAEREDGSSIMAETSIAIEIYADQSTKPLVALLPENQTEMPVLLQSPDDETEKSTADSAATSTVAQIGPRSLVWQDETKLSIGGQSRGGVRVTVSANGTFFGDALVLADGGWQVTGQVDNSRNTHRLEFVLVDNAGQAVARYLLPVRARDLQKGLDGSQLVVVNKGDALWRIAYRSFGKGVRYIDIVRKNTGDIDNPNLIYPNQIFALPKPGAAN